MGIDYLIFGSYWRNLTSPLTYWHRGTAFHFDAMKDHREMQVPHTELGTGMFLVTMAARITQAIVSLVRNRLQKRSWCWKMLSGTWLSRGFKAVLWMCWSVMDILLVMGMTGMYFNKSHSKHKLLCHTEKTMNSISIKYQWGYPAEPAKEAVILEEEEMSSNSTMKMEKLQEDTDSVWSLSSNTDKMVATENLALICTNPVILSMICQPAEDGESPLPSEESEMEDVEGLLENDSSTEEVSVDSGLQESWTLKSKEEEEESDWSDEDSWDGESETDYNNEAEDLWASFCQNDDPYNPLSFAMPTKSLQEQVKKEATTASLKKQDVSKSPDSSRYCGVFKVTCATDYKQRPRACKKPVLSSFKSSHKCYPIEELEMSKEFKGDENKSAKSVRFSATVTVRPIIAWSYAHRMARKGPWEEYARDRCRFQRRIAETEAVIGYCLNSHHREKIQAGLQHAQG